MHAHPEPVAGRGEGEDESPCVLIVEDDPVVQRLARAELSAQGFSVLSAFTADDGARLAADESPDLVLLDVVLPDRSGLDLLHALKARPATAGIPVLVLSATDEHTRVVGVGDPSQSIYGFNGADQDSMRHFTELFGAMRRPLSITYRFAPGELTATPISA